MGNLIATNYNHDSVFLETSRLSVVGSGSVLVVLREFCIEHLLAAKLGSLLDVHLADAAFVKMDGLDPGTFD